jgi:bacillithiol biosynthesis cysteine-adding enzyme BshC
MSTETLGPVLAQLKALLGESENGAYIYQQIEAAYTGHALYADATIDLVNRLFGKYGLVALNMNVPAFKRLFIPIMREELFQQSSQALIAATQDALTAAGFFGQAHARDINLFYLQAHRRDRIVREGDFFSILNTDLKFTPSEMEAELEAHPERFSPNVVLRPLFQELILPNLAYVGGGGEIAYWLERKSQFTHFRLNYPMLVRRNSVLWIDKATSSRMDKLGLRVQDLFVDTEFLIRQYVALHSEGELSLKEEMILLQALFEQVRRKALSVDPTLEKAVLAEAVKQEKVLEQLEGRLVRAEKQKHETGINQIRSLKEKLFPGNGLQERVDNFLNFYMKYGEGFGEVLKEVVDPFVEGFVVVRDEG